MALPYQFKPDYNTDDIPEYDSDLVASESENEADEDRLSGNNWCSCGHCEPMETTQMCIRCRELKSLQHKTEGYSRKHHRFHCIR